MFINDRNNVMKLIETATECCPDAFSPHTKTAIQNLDRMAILLERATEILQARAAHLAGTKGAGDRAMMRLVLADELDAGGFGDTHE